MSAEFIVRQMLLVLLLVWGENIVMLIETQPVTFLNRWQLPKFIPQFAKLNFQTIKTLVQANM